MALLDDIDRLLRDHVGYTGDGQGGNGALPVGDRSTRRHFPDQRTLRELLKIIAQTMGDPEALQEILTDLGGKANLADTTLAAANVRGTGNEIVADMPAGVAAGVAGIHRLTFVAPAENTVANPAITFGGQRRVLRDYDGAELPSGALIPGETYEILLAGPSTYRIIRGRLRPAFSFFSTRTTLEAAAAAGRLLPSVGAYVGGWSAPGDGGHCFLSRSSEVDKTGGFGVVVDSYTGFRAFGLTLTTEIPVPIQNPDWHLGNARAYYETGLEIPRDGIHVLSGAEDLQTHYIDFSSSAHVAEIDASTIPLNVPFRIVSRMIDGAKFVIDAGPGEQWANFSGHRFLICPAGTSIEFVKYVGGRVGIINSRESGGPITSADTHTRKIRSRMVLVGGQSILRQAFGAGNGAGSFARRYAQRIPGATTGFINVASGGSGICERDRPGGNSWVNMSNPSAPADGPLLVDAAAKIAARDGDPTQPLPSLILWDQGQTSAEMVDAPGDANANFTRKMYVDATVYALTRLRQMIGTNVPIIFQRIGRRVGASAHPARWQVIREAQLDVVAALAGAVVGPEAWDLPYKDELHPDRWGQAIMGWRLAEAAAAIEGVGVVTHPTISSVSYNQPRRYVDVTFDNGSITRYRDMAGFAVFGASGAQIAIARIHWPLSNMARLYLTSDAAGGRMCFGYGDIQIHNEALIARRIMATPDRDILAPPIRPSVHAL